MFYHSAWLSGNGLRRNVGVDRLYFNDSDPANPLLPVLATPNWLRAAGQYLNPFAAAVPAFTMAQASAGVFTSPSDDAGPESVAAMSGDGAQARCVDGIQDGAWTHTRQVDFGVGPAGDAQRELSLVLRVSVPACSPGDCPRLTMHLDSIGSAAVANCVLNSTSGEWVTVSCPIAGASSVHDVVFLFEGAECVTTMLQFGWWKVSGPRAIAAAAPTAPAKAVVELTMRACKPNHCTWKNPAVSNSTGMPVGVVALGTQGSVLAAKPGLAAARFVLHDNEDGTWGLRAGSNFACATPQPAGKLGGARLSLSASTSDAHCARFRVQVRTPTWLLFRLLYLRARYEMLTCLRTRAAAGDDPWRVRTAERGDWAVGAGWHRWDLGSGGRRPTIRSCDCLHRHDDAGPATTLTRGKGAAAASCCRWGISGGVLSAGQRSGIHGRWFVEPKTNKHIQTLVQT